MKAIVANGHDTPVRNFTYTTLAMYIGKQRLYRLVNEAVFLRVGINLLN
ncbi:MAG TPA: hypothetical protein PLX89_05770 [Verrucomicrobiota bacterium]|nr:hypothetical protein [Verrucomicrobiota bacterium]